MLRVIGEQSKRLQQQIDLLLDLSQIQAGHLSLIPQPTDLCRLVEEIVEDIQPTLEQHQVTFNCEDAALMIHGDALRLEQVLQI